MMEKRGIIEVLMMTDVDIGLNKPSTIPIEICKKMLTMIGDVDIGPRPENLSSITHVTMVDCCVHLLILVVSMIVFVKI